MNEMGDMQSEQLPLGLMLTLHRTDRFHTSMTVRIITFISYIYLYIIWKPVYAI